MTITVGIITVSDSGSRGERVDTAGPALAELCAAQGWEVAERAIVPDERHEIADLLRAWADAKQLAVVLTTGGTGFALRDLTPEATLDVIDRQAAGFAEHMRAESAKKTPLAAMSRAIAGTRGRTLIINLPGSERGARENFEAIAALIPHAVQLLWGDTGHHPPH
jgi:molybdopterin adenylyltransferase